MSAWPSNDDEIDAVREQFPPRSEALTAEALDPISLYCAPDAAGGNDAEARRGGIARLRRHEHGEMGRSHPATQSLCPDELGVLSQPSFPTKPERHRAARRAARLGTPPCWGSAPALYFL
jgi:hypothetical protein